MSDLKRKLSELLAENRAIRDHQLHPHNTHPWLPALQRWQSARLAHSHADLKEQHRYRAATEFFLSDLYGDRDFSARDRDVERVVPIMSRLLPDYTLEAVALAIDLNICTHRLDLHMVVNLPRFAKAGYIDQAVYASAYRATGERGERERQIGLIVALGMALDGIVARPMYSRMLRMLRMPARLAGLGKLQTFLERGFSAFEGMQGADLFLETIRHREHDYLHGIFDGNDQVFGFDRREPMQA